MVGGGGGGGVRKQNIRCQYGGLQLKYIGIRHSKITRAVPILHVSFDEMLKCLA